MKNPTFVAFVVLFTLTWALCISVRRLNDRLRTLEAVAASNGRPAVSAKVRPTIDSKGKVGVVVDLGAGLRL